MKGKVMPMAEGIRIDYSKLIVPEELLDSFAKSLVPEIRMFYESAEGKAYYKQWLEKHPEYMVEEPSDRSLGS